MPEITDEEFKVLQGSRQLMDQLLKSPKTKRDTEKLIKTLHPETVVSTDYDEPIMERIGGLEKKLDDYFKSEADKRIDQQLTTGFDELRKSGLTDDGIEQVKKIMLEKRIADPIVAGAFFEKMNPPKAAEPSSLTPTSWGFGGQSTDEDIKSLFADEDAWADRTAVRVWNQAKQGILTD